MDGFHLINLVARTPTPAPTIPHSFRRMELLLDLPPVITSPLLLPPCPFPLILSWPPFVQIPVLDQVPNLKVVMEHITTREAAEFVASAPASVAAT